MPFANGPLGNWQAIYAWLLLAGDERPRVRPPDDFFPWMAGIACLAFAIFPFPATEIAGELDATIRAEDIPAHS